MIYLVLTVLSFLVAGYYGAVRAILLDSPVDWLQSLHKEPIHRQHITYWRRILRMARLLLVALGCFFLVMSNQKELPLLQIVPEWLLIILYFFEATIAWLLGFLVWLRLGRAYTGLVSVSAFPVRFSEWLLTPVYWFLEPFVRDAHEVDALQSGRMPGFVREDTESADDSDFDDHRIEEKMFINALDFKDVRIRDCMIPRTEITAVAIDDEIEDLRQAFISSGHSKIVVYRESIDDVVGYCHSLALFRKPREIINIVTPMLIVPEAMPASDLMLRFLEERKSLALVVDEFGGTSGLVSVEDVVEQIFGEIQDEYDSTEDWTERKLDENTYLFSARHEVDYLNEKYGWEFPEGDYDTLAGLLIHIHGDLPKVNDVIEMSKYNFKIVSMQDTRIELVRLSVE